MSCTTSAEAHMVKGWLDEADIPCVLNNDNMSVLYLGITAAFSEVDILVLENQLEQAKEIVRKNLEQ